MAANTLAAALGTSAPTSRASTPTARARSSVVPFTRPSSGAPSVDDDASAPSSFVGSARALRGRSVPSAPSEAGSLRRPSWRPSPAVAPAAVVALGFAAPTCDALLPAPASPSSRRDGLLSRVLCVARVGVEVRGEEDGEGGMARLP